jgi:regulator of sigma E protease
MESILSVLVTIGIFIGAIFILVLIHELGHFLAAKGFGMRVERFSIGFPPRLFGFTKGDTDYCISATPLGGYVKISGMIDESLDESFIESEPQSWEYRSKPVWQRMIVIVAGVVFNMILAFIIYSGMFMALGSQEVPSSNVGSLFVPDSSFAQTVGFQTGDRLVSVNGNRPETYRGGNFFTMADLTSSDIVFQVERGGQIVDITAPAGFIDQLNKQPKFISLENALPSEISDIVVGSVAESAGIQGGDRIISVDSVSVDRWLQLTTLIKESEGELNLGIVRGSDTLSIAVTPQTETKTLGIYPVNPIDAFGVVTIDYGFFGAIGAGAVNTYESTAGILSGFGLLFSGDVSLRENLGGPLAIASVTRQATDRSGWIGFWTITAFLSITLAIMNMLPIPVLDGGHFVFLLYEAIVGREPSVKFRMVMQQAGMVLVFGLMIFVTFNDILRFFGG